VSQARILLAGVAITRGGVPEPPIKVKKLIK
jgi:hypothetical protein